VEDCPLKKQKKPPIIDPRLQDPEFQLKRLAVCHPGLLKKPQALATVASVKRQPGRKEQALINSGATDSVTNNVLFFTSMSPVSMSLIFASTDRFPVRQIGDVLLLTQYGRLKIRNVLYCPNCQNDNTVAMHSAEIVMRSICKLHILY
jgi:hypothetical protein